MSGARHWEQDKEATVYIGNLDERVSDALVWELMLQAGRIVNVHLPKDRVTQTHQGFGFVEFISEEDAEYAARIMNQVRLYGKPIRVNKASADKQKTVEVGAELFVGNLDPMVDEKTLYDTFSTFGNLVAAPKIARDDQGVSKGFGFISYDSFEASDKAIESMHNQFLMNKEINVQYAYKKDGKGERHGDQAERMLAAQAKKHNVQVTPQQLPAQLFAPTGPAAGVPPIPVGSGGPPPPSGPATSVGSSVGPHSSKWAVVLAVRPLNISNRCSHISHNLHPPLRDFQQGLRLQLDFNSINSINMEDPRPHLWDSSSRCILAGLQDSLLHYQQDLEGHPNCKDFQDKYLQVPPRGTWIPTTRSAA
ncbi:uncharacterized protein LAJ45_06856 [Morchella importuna]|uniref:uncharacterized protein n=1 Tax=Morchella importuna TaxID=1174673 RepID=UPI001E8D436F|nr:uncharacterized protein LAJ45_06856 [Morchella importuna]KAH8149316.1 hypothetical protein LAJ45_06856 [Morchella importuna]